MKQFSPGFSIIYFPAWSKREEAIVSHLDTTTRQLRGTSVPGTLKCLPQKPCLSVP